MLLLQLKVSISRIFCCLCCILPLPTSSVPSFDVDLDGDPEHRWDHVIDFYKHEIPGMYQASQVFFAQYSSSITNQFVANSGLDEDQTAEIRGMVNAYSSIAGVNVTFEEMVMAQLMYELAQESHCSGFLVALGNGTVVHGRNLDNQFPFTMPDGTSKNLKDVTFDVIYWRDRKPLMTSVNFPGGMGIHTGMRFGGWSIEQNTRSGNNWTENLAAAKQGGRTMTLVLRKALETIPDYESAVQYLWDVNFMAPQYLVVAGSKAYEGAVLTIDRGGVHKADTPPVKRLDSKPGIWHLYQSNDDGHGHPDDSRRPAASAMTWDWPQQDVQIDDVPIFMHTPPVFNPLTAFTWVAVPSTHFHETFLPSEGPSMWDGIQKFYGNNSALLATIIGMYPSVNPLPVLLQNSARAAYPSPKTLLRPRPQLRGAAEI